LGWGVFNNKKESRSIMAQRSSHPEAMKKGKKKKKKGRKY